MAVPEQTPYSEHTGNGVTTSFALGFQCETKDHLIVLVDDVEPPIATWSLNSGNVVFTTAPAAGKKITLQRNTPFSRTVDYQSYNNSFRPPVVNKDFDWIWWKLQELGVADWILGARIDALKNYVDRKDDELKAYLMEEIRKQGVALDQLDEYYNYLMERLAQIAVDKGWDASLVMDASGKNQQQLNNIFSEQFLTTEHFPFIIPEVDDTGRLQRAFDASFEKKQKLYLVGDFNCSDTIYARHDFDGSSSKITYPKDYSRDMLVFAAEKTLGTVRNSGKTVYFPSIYTTKTSGVNNWASNVGSCAIKIINPQECKFSFGETNSSELGVYVLAYNTDANYNTYDFGRHVYHKRPMTFHIQGDISVASMNQNTLNGGRFAVNIGASRISGIYLMHFLITGSTTSSCNNNLINNPSVEGSSDECAILFENSGTGSSLISYNTVNAPRLETGNVADKKILFKGNLVRWNRVMYGYGVDYDTVINESGAITNAISTSIGAMNLGGSLQNTAALNLQNGSGVNSPVLAIYGPTVDSSQFKDAPANANAYSTSAAFITRSTQTVDRFKLTYASGKMDWSGGASFDTNLYRAGAGRLKTDGSIECVGGFGLFGSTPPIAQRTIAGKKSPTTIAEQNAVLDSIVATLVAYGLVSDNRA